MLTIQDATLASIADAIRDKTGDSKALTPFEMADAIESISGGATIATGSFTTGTTSQERVEINCGFQPDIVIVDFLFNNQHTTCMCYTPHSSSVWDVRPAESVVHPVPMNTDGETGISEITSIGFNFRVKGSNTFGLPCDYIAIKL